jgi:hypothetical protein
MPRPERPRADPLLGELARSIEELEHLRARQTQWADRLVHLTPIPTEYLALEVAAAQDLLLRRHQACVEALERRGSARSGGQPVFPTATLHDHAEFALSLRELEGYLEGVRRDDHGGNRQALGQYWRVVLEALDRHLIEERRSLADAAAPRGETPASGPDGVISAAPSASRSEPTVALEDELSPNGVKVYKAMKEQAFLSEEKMGTAERITQSAKLPKNMVLNALQELQTKGFCRRKVREKAAGYYLTK